VISWMRSFSPLASRDTERYRYVEADIRMTTALGVAACEALHQLRCKRAPAQVSPDLLERAVLFLKGERG
jgi:hypothetical protein